MKTGSDKRLIMTKNLIMMFVILAVLLLAIFAWYSNNDTVSASGTSISAVGADEVELAVPEKVNGTDSFPKSNDSWSRDIQFKDSGYLKDLVKDVTSGGYQFVIPNFEAAKGLKEGRKVIADDVWVDGLSSKEALTNDKANDDDQYNYISLEFYMRSKIKDINVTADSFLAAGSELGYKSAEAPTDPTKPLTGSSVYRCSSYGAAEGTSSAFSSDAVVGAMRVSLEIAPVDGVSTSGGVSTETTYNGERTWEAASNLSFLWLPRPDVYLLTDDNSNNWRLYTGIKPSGNTAQGSLTANQLNDIAKQTYTHSFFEGNTVEGNVKKTLTRHIYQDSAVLNNVDGADANTPDYFKVSKTNDDSQLGNPGHYPTLGQAYQVANNALDASKSIQFTAGTAADDHRDITGYYVYKCRLNVWIEGEDAEARRSMNNGVFSLELDFGT